MCVYEFVWKFRARTYINELGNQHYLLLKIPRWGKTLFSDNPISSSSSSSSCLKNPLKKETIHFCDISPWEAFTVASFGCWLSALLPMAWVQLWRLCWRMCPGFDEVSGLEGKSAGKLKHVFFLKRTCIANHGSLSFLLRNHPNLAVSYGVRFSLQYWDAFPGQSNYQNRKLGIYLAYVAVGNPYWDWVFLSSGRFEQSKGVEEAGTWRCIRWSLLQSWGWLNTLARSPFAEKCSATGMNGGDC